MAYDNEVYAVDSYGYVQLLHDCLAVGAGDLFLCNGDSYKNKGDSKLLCFRELYSSTSTDYCPFDYELTLTTQCFQTNILGKILVM